MRDLELIGRIGGSAQESGDHGLPNRVNKTIGDQLCRERRSCGTRRFNPLLRRQREGKPIRGIFRHGQPSACECHRGGWLNGGNIDSDGRLRMDKEGNGSDYDRGKCIPNKIFVGDVAVVRCLVLNMVQVEEESVV